MAWAVTSAPVATVAVAPSPFVVTPAAAEESAATEAASAQDGTEGQTAETAECDLAPRRPAAATASEYTPEAEGA